MRLKHGVSICRSIAMTADYLSSRVDSATPSSRKSSMKQAALKDDTRTGRLEAIDLFEKTGWDRKWANRPQKNRIQQLIAAGALIAAEIDRLRREEATPDCEKE